MTTLQRTPLDEHVETRQVLAFVRLWAAASIIHLSLANGARLDTPFNLVGVVSGVVLLVNPRSGPWLVVLLVSQLADFAWEMPLSPDHYVLMAFGNLALLLTFLLKRSVAPSAIGAAFPTLRWMLLLAYSSAALAKYNHEFLNAVDSCATAMARASSFGLTDKLDAGPLWVSLTLACETAIPILLLIPATRRHGVRLGFVFHFMLTISPVVQVEDFSATLYAFFFLFLSADDAARLLDKLGHIAGKSAVARDASRFPWVAACLGLFVVGGLGYLGPVAGFAGNTVLTAVYLTILLVCGLWSWPGNAPGVRRIGRPEVVTVPLIPLLLFVCLNPYLGLRTMGSFTMFSGVRTEADLGNHLFLPNLRLATWQDDIVVVTSANAVELDQAEERGLGVPLVSLRQLAEEHEDLEVAGKFHGAQVVFGPGEGQQSFTPLTWWERKLLLFRPVPVDGRGYCTN